jgi:hypothetical protein
MIPAPESWVADTIRLACLLPADVAPGILADRYLAVAVKSNETCSELLCG